MMRYVVDKPTNEEIESINYLKKRKEESNKKTKVNMADLFEKLRIDLEK